MERYEEAVRAYKEAARLDPQDASTYYNMGIALDKLGRYEEALRAYEETLRLDPNDVDAHEKKGEALLALYPYIPPLSRPQQQPDHGERQE